MTETGSTVAQIHSALQQTSYIVLFILGEGSKSLNFASHDAIEATPLVMRLDKGLKG